MSVHSTFYRNEEDYLADLASEYRTEQNNLYWNDDDIPNPDMCDNCIHNKFLYTKEDGTKVWECDTHCCEYVEVEDEIDN